MTNWRLDLAIYAIKVAIKRLEEIRYQKASEKQVKFLKEALKLIDEQRSEHETQD